MIKEVKTYITNKIFNKMPDISILLYREIRILEKRNPTKQFIAKNVSISDVVRNDHSFTCVTAAGNLVKIPRIIKENHREETLKVITNIPATTKQKTPSIRKYIGMKKQGSKPCKRKNRRLSKNVDRMCDNYQSYLKEYYSKGLEKQN
jgi:hypothetical protein